MTEILWFIFGALAGVFATLLVIVNSIKPPKPNPNDEEYDPWDQI